MSCPDWSRLAAARDNRDNRDNREGTEPEGLAEAVAHFDSCSLCRKEALKADPLLVFRRMPAVEIEENLEVESMQQAVAAMRTARRLETRGRFAGWRRWAAAAVLAGASLSVGRDMDRNRVPQLEQAVAAEAPPAPVVSSGYTAAPVLEGIDSPEARVYEVGDENFSAVMVIDESFESLDV